MKSKPQLRAEPRQSTVGLLGVRAALGGRAGDALEPTRLQRNDLPESDWAMMGLCELCALANPIKKG
jgi:hypothetical protein